MKAPSAVLAEGAFFVQIRFTVMRQFSKIVAL